MLRKGHNVAYRLAKHRARDSRGNGRPLLRRGKSTIGAEEVIVPPVVRSSLQGNANVATPKAIGYWLLGMSGLWPVWLLLGV